MNKLWEVMGLYQYIANSNGHGKSWANMCKKKSINSVQKAMVEQTASCQENSKEYYYVTDALGDVIDVIWAVDNETNDGSIEYFSDTAIDFMTQAFKAHEEGVQ